MRSPSWLLRPPSGEDPAGPALANWTAQPLQVSVSDERLGARCRIHLGIADKIESVEASADGTVLMTVPGLTCGLIEQMAGSGHV